MSLFSDHQWVDVDEPLRRVLHPDTKKLAVYAVALVVAVAIWSVLVTPSVAAGLLAATVYLTAGIVLIVRNHKLNPVSSAPLKHVVNGAVIFAGAWFACYLIACLSTELATILDVMTPAVS